MLEDKIEDKKWNLEDIRGHFEQNRGHLEDIFLKNNNNLLRRRPKITKYEL